MSGFITALLDTTTGISASTFWDALTGVVPLLVMIIPVAIGFYIVRKVFKPKKVVKGNVSL